MAWIKAMAMEMKSGRLVYVLEIELTVLDNGFDMGSERKWGI